MFQSPGWTPPKEPQSSSGEYYFYDFQENYLMVPASDGSSGWSLPDQLPTSPMSNLMSLDTSDHHTLPTVESLLGNQLQGDWSPSTESPSREWDPPSLPQMQTYYHGNNQGRLLQSSTHSSCDTGTSDDSHEWTPPMQVPALMPPRMPTSQPQTPTPHHKHAGRTPPFHCSSDSSSDTDMSEDSEGWTPPSNAPSDIFYQASTMLSHPTPSPMSVLPIASAQTNQYHRSSLLSGLPLSSIPSEGTDIPLNNIWPRVIGTSPIAHNKLVNKGKVWEAQPSAVSQVPVTCPIDVEGQL